MKPAVLVAGPVRARSLVCREDRRRERLWAGAAEGKSWNGIDYVEVGEDHVSIAIYFIGRAPRHVVPANFRISGGRRVTGLRVIDVAVCRSRQPDLDDCMRITVDRPGDGSVYRLCLVETDADGEPGGRPLAGFDPFYACIDFTFTAGCPSDLDCRRDDSCPPEAAQALAISYLAKDYASFRQLILDRMALVIPDWTERHAPDLGVTLVELLAYVGDRLSYRQDAVATEAYLETARRRVSVRRHARLVDHRMHEGCSARALVHVATAEALEGVPGETLAFVALRDLVARESLPAVLAPEQLGGLAQGAFEVFEPIAGEPLSFFPEHNQIPIYTWGDAECCLVEGATRATLLDGFLDGPAGPVGVSPAGRAPEAAPSPASSRLRRLRHLKAGDLLIFEEVLGRRTGAPADADPGRRHAVRLTAVTAGLDEALGNPVVEIAWSPEDGLPFDLCLSIIGPAPDCSRIEGVTVARGNLVVVDHGRRIGRFSHDETVPEPLGQVTAREAAATCSGPGRPRRRELFAAPFPAQLARAPLAFVDIPSAGAAATALARPRPWAAVPALSLTSHQQGEAGELSWRPRPDLLESDADAAEFVVEMDDDGTAHLRFGDGVSGRALPVGSWFEASYRVGGGPAGNLGPEAISRVVVFPGGPAAANGWQAHVRNPLPASGGTAAEAISHVKAFAPGIAATVLERAITAEDYATLAGQVAGVQRAAATLNWNGSWYEALVVVDPLVKVADPHALLERVYRRLRRARRMGHALAVAPAREIAVDVGLRICVSRLAIAAHVEADLLARLGAGVQRDGTLGLFHPDNITFGAPVVLSRIVALAQATPGVLSVQPLKLERQGLGPQGELEAGELVLGPLELARMDNDPGRPENGSLQLEICGGR